MYSSKFIKDHTQPISLIFTPNNINFFWKAFNTSNFDHHLSARHTGWGCYIRKTGPWVLRVYTPKQAKKNFFLKTHTSKWRIFLELVCVWIELCREQHRKKTHLAQAWQIKEGFLEVTAELSVKKKESSS